jgi:hypothetical protein
MSIIFFKLFGGVGYEMLRSTILSFFLSLHPQLVCFRQCESFKHEKILKYEPRKFS